LSAGIISVAGFFSVVYITFTSLPINVQYVVLHITFSQLITKITETENIKKLKLNRTEINFCKNCIEIELKRNLRLKLQLN